MKKCNCECCGAGLPIPNRYDKYIKCEYCGATYEVENYLHNFPLQEIKYILVQPGHIQKFAAQVIIPHEYLKTMSKEELMPYIREELTRKIAESILPYLKIKEDFNLYDLSTAFKTYLMIDTSTIMY